MTKIIINLDININIEAAQSIADEIIDKMLPDYDDCIKDIKVEETSADI